MLRSATNRETITRTTGRLAVIAVAEEPRFVPRQTPYVTDRDPVTATTTIDLRELVALPNAEADTHTVTYQVTMGLHSPDMGFYRDTREFVTYTTEVSGCAEAEDDGGTGSVDGGSLGSLTGDGEGSSGSNGSEGSTREGGFEAGSVGSMYRIGAASTGAASQE